MQARDSRVDTKADPGKSGIRRSLIPTDIPRGAPAAAPSASGDADALGADPVHAGRHLRTGLELSRKGETEGAVVAFRSALRCTLDSELPGDLVIRRLAAEHLLGLLRGDAA